MAVTTFYPVDVAFRAYDSHTEIRIYGRRADGRQICVIDRGFPPHFYIILKDMNRLEEFGKKLQNLKVPMKKGEAKVVRLEVINKRHDRKNRDCVKVVVQTPYELYPIANALSQMPEIEDILEVDIPYTKRYVVERQINPLNLMEAEGSYETRQFRVPVFEAKKITQSVGETLLPRAIFFDIKTQEVSGRITGEDEPIVAISFFGKEIEKTITWKRFTTPNANIEFVDSESELIQKFERTIEEYSPDVIVGFLSDKFDIPHLIKRAQKYKIKLSVGLDFSPISINKKVEIEGIPHLDLSHVLRRVFSRRSEFDFEDIDNVTKELLSEEVFAENKSTDIEDICAKSSDEVRKYAKMYEKTFPFLFELSKLTGLTIRDTAELSPFQIPEWYLFRNAIMKNMLVANRVPEKQESLLEEEEIIVEPQERIYKNIFSLDLRNMSASLASKFNISNDSKRCADCKNITKQDPWFCQTRKGLIPEILDDLISRKSRIKGILSGTDESKKTIALVARSEAVSILVHFFSKYITSPKSRYYDDECASILKNLEETTRKNIIKKVQEKGFKLVYFDADFLFLGFNNKRKEEANIICAVLNELYHADLDVEGIFKSGFFVMHKKGKKFIKYALLLPDKTIRTKGFVMTQRSFGNVAKQTQEKILKLILENGELGPARIHLQEVITRLRKKEFPNKDVVLSNDLQKDAFAYDTDWPFVAVAKKMIEKGIPISRGSTISYIIAEGKEKISDRAKMPEDVPEGEYDAEHYVNTQLIPAVSDIFEAYNFTKETLVEVKEQSKLNEFFKK